MDIINRHNTHSESERIQKQYTEQLWDLTHNQYYSGEYPSTRLQYSILDPDYYWPSPRGCNTQHTILQVITPHHQIQWMFSIGMHVDEENVLFYMDIDFLEKRCDQQKAGR